MAANGKCYYSFRLINAKMQRNYLCCCCCCCFCNGGLEATEHVYKCVNIIYSIIYMKYKMYMQIECVELLAVR